VNPSTGNPGTTSQIGAVPESSPARTYKSKVREIADKIEKSILSAKPESGPPLGTDSILKDLHSCEEDLKMLPSDKRKSVEAKVSLEWYKIPRNEQSALIKLEVLKKVISSELEAVTDVPETENSVEGNLEDSILETVTPKSGGATKVTPQESYSRVLMRDVENIKSVSWAVIMNKENAEEASKAFKAKMSLLYNIRAKSNIGGENRILLPKNLEKTLPGLYKSILDASLLAGVEIVPDEATSVNPANPAVWLNDPEARDKALEQLRKKSFEKELSATATLAALIALLGEIPTEESLSMTGPGRLAVAFIAHLTAGIFLEQEENIPLSQSADLWKVSQNLRQEVSKDLLLALGDDSASKQITLGLEILYRKFIRKVFSEKDNSKSEALRNLSRGLVSGLVASGTTVFLRNLRIQTSTQKVSVPDASSKKQGATKVIEQKKVAVLRPKLIEGPMSVLEEKAVENINKVLNRYEQGKVKDYSQVCGFMPLNEWQKNIKDRVEKLYDLVSLANKKMSSRKDEVRQHVYASRPGYSARKEGTSGRGIKEPAISLAEWTKSFQSLSETKGGKWTNELEDALAIAFKSNSEDFLDWISVAEPDQIEVRLDNSLGPNESFRIKSFTPLN